MASGQKPEDTLYRIGSLGSKESTPMASAQTLITYTPPGYLLFVRDRTLGAQRFDLKGLKTVGEPAPLAEKIGTDAVSLARFSVSTRRSAYRTSDSGIGFSGWVEAERAGTAGGDREYRISVFAEPRLSTCRTSAEVRHLRPRPLARRNSHFTFGAGTNICPWSRRSRIVFTSEQEGISSLLEKPATGQGEEKLLLKSADGRVVATDWLRDGKYIAYSHRGKEGWDVLVLPTFGDRKAIPVAHSPFNELTASFSPDGRFIAYQSNESGRSEVYVQTFPDPGGKWQVSTAGGLDASWRADGKGMFYRAPDQTLMEVDVQTAGTFQAGIPQPLFLGRVPSGGYRNRTRRRPTGSASSSSRRSGASPDADDGRPELVRRPGTLT
jgi:hypothetical protein